MYVHKPDVRLALNARQMSQKEGGERSIPIYSVGKTKLQAQVSPYELRGQEAITRRHGYMSEQSGKIEIAMIDGIFYLYKQISHSLVSNAIDI